MSPTERRVAAILAAHLAEQHPGSRWSVRRDNEAAHGGEPAEPQEAHRFRFEAVEAWTDSREAAA